MSARVILDWANLWSELYETVLLRQAWLEAKLGAAPVWADILTLGTTGGGWKVRKRQNRWSGLNGKPEQFDTLLGKLRIYFKPNQNVWFERRVFSNQLIYKAVELVLIRWMRASYILHGCILFVSVTFLCWHFVAFFFCLIIRLNAKRAYET